MDDEDDMSSAVLVRRFSEKVAAETSAEGSNGTLRTIVAKNCEDEEQRQREDPRWRKYFEPTAAPDVEGAEQSPLEKAANRLKEAWGEFTKSLQPEDRARFEKRPPDFKDVEEAVARVEKQWEANRCSGKFKSVRSGWKKCCLSIKSHETMLRVLPDGNEYCSLFTGVLKSVVYATANHERVANAMSQALCEIGEVVETCLEVCELYDTAKVRTLVLELYAHIFLYFRGMLDWFRKKRLKRVLDSFNEDLSKDQEDLMLKIRDIAGIMDKRLLRGKAAEVRVTRIGVESSQADIRRALAELQDMRLQQGRHESKMDELYLFQKEEARRRLDHEERLQLMSEQSTVQRQALLFNNVVVLFNGQLTDQADEFRMDRIARSFNQRLLVGQLPITPPTIEERATTREDVLADSTHLEDYFGRDSLRINIDDSDVLASDDLASSLEDWMLAKSSSLLSIAGPDTNMHSLDHNPLSKVAAAIVKSADAASIPVISYFCSLDRRWRLTEGETMEARGLIALVYALIRQLIELLPPGLNVGIDLGSKRLQSFDGTLESWESCITLLGDLLSCTKPVLYCIIDGIQWLDNRSTARYLDEFVELIKRAATMQERTGVVMKVLFSTTGRSSCLLRNLDRTALIFEDEGGFASRGYRGGQVLSL